MARLLPAVPVLLALLLLLTGARAAEASTTQVMTFEAPLELLDDSKRERTLDEIQAFGVTRVRVLVYWNRFSARRNSRTRPSFDTTDHEAYPAGTWDILDRLVDSVQRRGMELQMTLSGPVPKWATAKRRDHLTRPSPELFGRWVRAIATRYGDRVDIWSVFNEPNHPEFLKPQFKGDRAISPGLYRKLYVEAEKQLHGVRGGRRDVVLFGETAPVGNQNVVAPLAFMRGALCLDADYDKRAGCRKLRIDGYAHHAYARKGDPEFDSGNADDVSIGNLSRLSRALDRAASAGAIGPDRPIFLTEFGVQSFPDRIAGVSERKQAEYLAISEHIAYLNPRVKVFSQYLMRDDEAHPDEPLANRYPGFETGLRRNNGRKKAAYNAFMLPLRVSEVGSSHILWGRVRPATDPVEVVIQRDTGDGFERLTATQTGSGGVFGLGTQARSGARYRVRWTRADGITITGPPIRPY